MIPQISAGELKRRLDTPGDTTYLLDVRETGEFAFCNIPGSTLIPLGELPGKAGTLPPDRDIVVICHHGNRSNRAAAFLQQARGLRVLNLAGGVDAWAQQVDPAMKRY